MSEVKVTTHYRVVPSEFPEDIPIIFELDSSDVKIRIGFTYQQQCSSVFFLLVCELTIGPWLPIMFMRSTADMEFSPASSTEEAQHMLEMEIAKLGVLVMYKLQRELMDEGLISRKVARDGWQGFRFVKDSKTYTLRKAEELS